MKEVAMYKRYENVTPMGVQAFCNTFGIAIFEPDEIDKYKEGCELVAAWSTTQGLHGFHKHQIFYSTSGRAFIRKGSLRIYLDEVMRVA